MSLAGYTNDKTLAVVSRTPISVNRTPKTIALKIKSLVLGGLVIFDKSYLFEGCSQSLLVAQMSGILEDSLMRHRTLLLAVWYLV
jgi:hypothetical protein